MLPQLADDETARALAFVVCLDVEGYHPTIPDLEAYADNPQRPGRQLSLAVAGALQAILAATTTMYGPRTKMSDYLIALRWIQVSDDLRIGPTELGKAVARAIARRSVEQTEIVKVFLDPDDPFVVSRVVERIAELGPGMLVDPYFRLDQLLDIFQRTSINRVLTSEQIKTPALSALEQALAGTTGRALEIRAAIGKTVHDRHLIGDDGTVVMVGASMNSLGKVSSVIVDITDGREDIARHYNKVWEGAIRVGSTHRPDQPTPAAPIEPDAPAKARRASRPTDRAGARKATPK